MKKCHSIRLQLSIYPILLMLICAATVSILSFQVSDMVEESVDLLQSNQSLSEFYKAIDAMDYSAREYIYSPSDENIQVYQENKKIAREYLEDCKRKIEENISWRIVRLGYMVDYYETALENYMDGNAGQYETYELLKYRADLIENTATKYYGYLASSMYDHTYVMKERWNRKSTLLIAISAGIILIGLFFGFYYTKKIYHPLSIMVANTERMKKEEYEFERSGTALDELRVLEEAFFNMSEHVKSNIETLRENAKLEQELLRKENENLVMRNLVTEAELRNLQSQINPHFLFNTMSMIAKSSYLNGDHQTSELMDRLSAFLRYALDKANKNSTIYEEVESVKNYIFIQQKRFGERVKFLVTMEEGVPNISIPAVILQPLIENAIIHGVGNMTENAEVILAVKVRNDNVVIHIEDNGNGMTGEQLEELQVYLHRIITDPSSYYVKKSIGIANVFRRLHMYYNQHLDFVVTSEEDCGTIITISISISKETWDEQ